MEPQLSWNIVQDIRQLFEFPFMVNAYRAGTVVAITAALVGWFMVLRRQTFAGHTLAVVGFPGASGALLIGVGITYGYLAFTIGAALVIAAFSGLGRGSSQESAVIGTVQAFALASGFLFVSISHRNVTSAQGLLFGSFIGITSDEVALLFGAAIITVVILGFLARPLLFASIDPDVAAARGVPVRGLSVAFLVILGVGAGEASQVTGSLLIFALLVLPAATAEALTVHPARSIMASVLIGLAVTWLGLGLAYYYDYPIGFYITTLASVAYVLARVWKSFRGSRLRTVLA